MNTFQIVSLVLGIVVFLSAAFLGLLYLIYFLSFRRKSFIGKQVNKQFVQNLSSYGIDHSWWSAQDVEELEITNDNLKLKGYFIKNKNAKKNRLAIVIHGYFSNHKDMMPQAKIFLENGFNVFCPDLRAHGNSEGTTVGMGYFDSGDIQIWLTHLLNKLGNNTEVIIMGLSMGAATTVMLSGEPLPNNVKCLIEDCGYTSAYEEVRYLIKRYKLPTFPLLQLTNLATKLFGGYWLTDACPIEYIKRSTLPMYFIHGNTDTFVPAFMVDELYNAKAIGQKEKYIFNAEHAKSYGSDKTRYENIYKDIINKYFD